MSETPNWSTAGSNIMEPQQLAAIRNYLEKIGFIAVLWWHYYGASAPTPLAFDNFDEFVEFLETQPREGDALDVWPFPSGAEQRIAEGKIPNAKGEVPSGGAY